jgi:PIN domain nuclease of toxin-antitoxin system
MVVRNDNGVIEASSAKKSTVNLKETISSVSYTSCVISSVTNSILSKRFEIVRISTAEVDCHLMITAATLRQNQCKFGARNGRRCDHAVGRRPHLLTEDTSC